MGGSYRTYEEWKQYVGGLSFRGFRVSSYRTYEEWKPNFCKIFRREYIKFLPYL